MPSKSEINETLESLGRDEQLYLLCLYSFPDFYQLVFSQTLDDFKWGWHLEDFSNRLQWEPRTCTLGSRSHGKSYTLYAYLAWLVFRLPIESNQVYYVSANYSLAHKHTSTAREFIDELQSLGYLEGIEATTPAQGLLNYRHRPTGRKFNCEPLAIASKMRGRHCDVLICDDLMGREDNEATGQVSLTEIENVKTVFFNDLFQLPSWQKGAQLHVTGNAVDPEDIIFTLKKQDKTRVENPQDEGFDWASYPAIIGGTPPDYADGEPLWPEVWDMKTLQSIRKTINDGDPQAFARQYLCVPERKTTAFITDEELDSVVMDEEEEEHALNVSGPSYAGIDLGKVRHPSHIAIFTLSDGALWQRESIFLDQIDHMEQIDFCKQLIRDYNIKHFFYDSHGSEWTVPEERGELPRQLAPMPLQYQNRMKVAQSLRRCLNGHDHQLKLLPHSRQNRQILSVDDNLQSPDQRGSHGDAFFSIALACHAAILYGNRGASPTVVGNAEGGNSLFDELDIGELLDNDIWEGLG